MLEAVRSAEELRKNTHGKFKDWAGRYLVSYLKAQIYTTVNHANNVIMERWEFMGVVRAQVPFSQSRGFESGRGVFFFCFFLVKK